MTQTEMSPVNAMEQFFTDWSELCKDKRFSIRLALGGEMIRIRVPGFHWDFCPVQAVYFKKTGKYITCGQVFAKPPLGLTSFEVNALTLGADRSIQHPYPKAEAIRQRLLKELKA